MSVAEFFGNPDQQALQRRARALWEVVRDDPRLMYYGRTVSIVQTLPESLELMRAMARLQGVCSSIYTPNDLAPGMFGTLAAEGFTTDRFEILRGGPESLTAARAILAENALPEDLTVEWMGPDSGADSMAALDDVTSSAGVLLIQGGVVRGLDRRSVCLMVREPGGRAVGAAAACACNHPDNAFGHEAWWGMLATREDRRGQRIALVLGAMAMVEMHARHGFAHFCTGVRADNMVSWALCARLGVGPSDYAVMTAIDPTTFGAGRMTK